VIDVKVTEVRSREAGGYVLVSEVFEGSGASGFAARGMRRKKSGRKALTLSIRMNKHGRIFRISDMVR
jgi:hypothetical protein